ncbi:hypothetical protein EPUS_05380 [Endocarpon pusillum Z07020]|uniref:Uncharacterized protein n=1 Tax=Endocarpon pusillum (strain Z07020 / HMAS-L-300199) TaxID=1263415 RepID=U1G908_ENDPU|nr:uncharacterized protein EPUS_05380 [Endocarpon pusillum Z07020]ERF73957.1 hypothetical protein EPUS_05380 [Endocarpon pusillum Z07020]
MGQGPSKPGPPTTQMQVLGLGVSRTGTASFSGALEILLQGPSYHGGANLLAGSDIHMLRWNEILRISYKMRHNPASVSTAERVYQKFLIVKQLEGFVAVADAPCNMYAEILMDLYPDAKIIVTTRDEENGGRALPRLFKNLIRRPTLTCSFSGFLVYDTGQSMLTLTAMAVMVNFIIPTMN